MTFHPHADVTFHRYADVFPLLEGAPFEELAEDIKAHGLREKIWLLDDKILDGRNRFLACRKVKIEPAYRKYTGKDPLSFVVSVNLQRRHLTESQRAMAAAKIATIRQGARTDLAQICAKSQTDAAEQLNVSRRSVQHARKVIEAGSADLQAAVAQGEVAVSKAASVVDLPKRRQLAAATAVNLDERWEPDANEIAAHATMERELAASVDKVMQADDKLAAAYAEIKRQAEEIAVLKLSRDGYMNGRQEVIKRYKQAQRQIERLEHEVDRLRARGFA